MKCIKLAARRKYNSVQNSARYVLAIASFGVSPGLVPVGFTFADFRMKGVRISIQALLDRSLARFLVLQVIVTIVAIAVEAKLA